MTPRGGLVAMLLAFWAVLSGSPSAVAAEGWVLPLAGPVEVTRPFDPPQHPYGPGHRGVDLAGTPGEAVLAAGAGVVSFAGPVAGRGVVTVTHDDGLRTTYEPVSASASAGTAVAAGTVIGTLLPGHPGCPVPACLHWGLRRGEVYLDPMSLLGGPVRLLPTAADGVAGTSAEDSQPDAARSGFGPAVSPRAEAGAGGDRADLWWAGLALGAGGALWLRPGGGPAGRPWPVVPP